ncbi:MAG: RHS repeat-associated core domain-containing protein [Bacteroidia bacterium]|nr:RHS repeat-associated core domain-containing protein [Bacteroidia bacterium]
MAYFEYFYPPGTVYYFAIEAVDEAGNSRLSNVVRMAIGTERTGTTISTPSLEPAIQPGEDLFRLKLYYNETFAEDNIHVNADPQYNGNISGMVWQNIRDCRQQGYGFAYDKMNRLTDAGHEIKNTSAWNLNDDRYSVNDITYDKNGNILTLNRMGLTGSNPALTASYSLMDELSYTYSGNRLTKLTDGITATLPAGVDHFVDGANTPTEYLYDDAGNVTTDANKGVTVAYNHLNKPHEITFTGGPNINQKIRYIYDAAGTKLSQEVVNTSNTVTKTSDYVGAFHYEDGALMFFHMEEGRVRLDGSDWVYEYPLKVEDPFIGNHLGNVRVTFGDLNDDGILDPNTEIQDANDYYPFGLRMAGENTLVASPGNEYLYNGKELQTELGLGWYDYGARMYAPDEGRWKGVDALAEKYVGWSPYNYVMGSPMVLVDPEGRNTVVFTWYWDENKDKEGNVTRTLQIKYLTTVEDNLTDAFTFVDAETAQKVVALQAKGGNAYKNTAGMKDLRRHFGVIDKTAWNSIWGQDDWADKNKRERASIIGTNEDGSSGIYVQNYDHNTENSAKNDFLSDKKGFDILDYPNAIFGNRISDEKKNKGNWIHIHTHYTNGGPPSDADKQFYEGTPLINQSQYHLITEKQTDATGATVKFLQVIVNTGSLTQPKFSHAVYVPASEIQAKTFKK